MFLITHSHIWVAVVMASSVVAPNPSIAEPSKPSTDAGFVLDIYGKWRMEGKENRQLSMGEALPIGAAIRAVNPEQRDNYITIAYLDGQAKIYACSVRATCYQPIEMPKTKPKPSTYTAIVEAVKRLFRHDPYQYVSALSRSEELKEGVVELRGRRINLQPMFRNMRKGFYLLLLEPISEGVPPAAEIETLKFLWNPGQPTPLQVGRLKPGAYNVVLLDPYSSSLEPLGIDAWMVVATPENYEAAQQQFNYTMKLIESWKNNVKPDAARAFLRASLLNLAAQSQ